MSEKFQMFATQQRCHRTARNRWRFHGEVVATEISCDNRVLSTIGTEINRFYRIRQHRKSPTRTMSKRQQQQLPSQKVSFKTEKIALSKKCWRISVVKCSHLFYVACLMLSFLVEPTLCNTPPRYKF